MNEFICPNGRMSVNGVCPIFEGDDGQVKDFKDNQKSIFEFDFEKPTKAAFEKADNIIKSNINYYHNFVEENLGIPSNLQTGLRIGSAALNVMQGGGILTAVAPFAIPFMAGGVLKSNEQNRIQNITMQDTQGDVKTFPTNIMNIQPTPRDRAMGGGGNNNQGAFGSSVNEATGARGSGTGFSDYS